MDSCVLKPTLQIGKNGITPGLIDEINLQLKKKKIIKIKILKSALERTVRKQIAKELAEKSNSQLISLVGFVIVLKKQ
ncbi:YhbY family RNA-binding protein [Candidatus Woesearchaeota archaeon]|nr:YhbY family RNA-binding protein [Candidatus Woesearchaeota archaeon]